MALKRALYLTAALVAAVSVLIGISLPASRLTLDTGWSDGSVPGIIHVHTNRSDGSGSPDDVAAAAARAGLKFVVLTDHGDATRAPDPPVYRHGVLCIDAVEIGTWGGHYLALDMPQAPYPLNGEARDVAEDVKRLGGFGIVAHPDSPRDSLHWRDWAVAFDGLEILNLDTGWRILAARPTLSARWRLFRALFSYTFRPSETIASLIQPSGAAADWARAAEGRRVVLLAAADAHAKLETSPSYDGVSLPLPSYDAAFQTISVHVTPSRALSGDAIADAALLMAAIRGGHVYAAVDGVASPPSFSFTATNGVETAGEGDELPLRGPITLRVRSNAPAAFTTILFNGSDRIGTEHHDQDFSVTLPRSVGVYRVIIDATDRAVPVTWLASNPIYVRDTSVPTVPAVSSEPPAPAPGRTIFDGQSTAGWHVEQDARSLANVQIDGSGGASELQLQYTVSGGETVGQYAGLVFDTPTGVDPGSAVALSLRAERPMRVSVQLRAPVEGRESRRWQRSLYLDSTTVNRTIAFDDMRLIGAASDEQPAYAEVRSLLIVVDTTNSRPGASGRLWIRSAAIQP